MIGGTTAGAGNTIAGNIGQGIDTDTSNVQAEIEKNTIYDNTGLGIDLGNDGVTANQPLGTPGPNNYQDYPVITAAVTTGIQITIGTIETVQIDHNYRIEYFANPTDDPSDHGQGEIYLGNMSILGNATGAISGSTVLTATVPIGYSISATMTDLTTSTTSEFAQDVHATGPNTVVVNTTEDISGGNLSSITSLMTDNGTHGLISLREAITAANNTSGDNSIEFDIPTNDPGYDPANNTFTIDATSPLPEVTAEDLSIDATTQPGYNDTPIVELSGTSEPSGTNGIEIQAANVTVRGFSIVGFSGSGIQIEPQGNSAIIANDYLGIEPNGITADGNGYGVVDTSACNVVIGGDSSLDRDVISGNTEGICLEDSAFRR